MNATRAQELTDRFPASFEEFRDLWAAEETREGLIGLMQRVILRLLNTLVVMLAESRERRLAEALAGDVTPPAAPKGAGGKKAPARGSCCAHCSYGRDTRFDWRRRPRSWTAAGRGDQASPARCRGPVSGALRDPIPS